MTELELVPRQPWDRQPGESDASWSAFVYFRDMGPDIRSVPCISRDLGHATTTVHKWSIKFNWRERSAAWDLHCDQIHQVAFENEVKLMAERHARLAVSMQDLGGQRIGQFTESPILQAELTARDAIALIDTGIKIEREARSADKEKNKGEAGNITINFNMPTPKWAPEALRKQPMIVQGEVIEENAGNAQEAAARPTTTSD